MDCGHLFSRECVNCERAHSILKAGNDPLASKELARWIEGGLSGPEQGSDALLDFAETENITHSKALVETETHPDKRKILFELLSEEEAKHLARIAASGNP
jgi:hypothetical protein